MQDSYLTLNQQAESEIIIKKSRFITSAAPVGNEQDAVDFIKAVADNHKKANHNVFAYRIDDRIQKYSDDGEPGGSAGLPVLEVLNQKEIAKVVLVVSRYFGGIKLGAGGLVRAYKEAAVKGITAAGVLQKLLYRNVHLTMDYQWLGPVKREVEKAGGRHINIDYAEKVKVNFLLRPDAIHTLSERLIDLTAAQIQVNDGKSIYLGVDFLNHCF